MSTYIHNFLAYRELLKELVNRDIKIKYRGSVLGILWSVLNPLGMMIIMSIVFSHVFRGNIENFPVYLMCGQIIFNFYNEASTVAMGSILGNAALIRKVYVPKYLFPMSKVCSCFVNLLTSFIALLLDHRVYGNKADLVRFADRYPDFLYFPVFLGNGTFVICSCGGISRSDPFVRSVIDGMDVSDADLLSGGYFTGVGSYYRGIEPVGRISL